MRWIYLDHAATTPVRQEVLDAMMPYFSEYFGNASSIHQAGQKAKKALEDARETVAGCIGAEPREIYFTSGGTESNNLAVKGILRANREKGRHLITSEIEHLAVLKCCRSMEDEGFRVTYLPVDTYGVVDLKALEGALGADTVLVSVMLGNNETGTIQPISEISNITGEKGILLHSDAVQAIGKIRVDVDTLGVDLLSIAGHKIYGPKGIGALYVRGGTTFASLFHGGAHERMKRPGTENVAFIVGFAEALKLAKAEMGTLWERVGELRNSLERRIKERIGRTHLNGHPTQRLPHILNMGFEAVDGESLLLTLDLEGIALSMGAACASGASEPSHVLQAMGIEPSIARAACGFLRDTKTRKRTSIMRWKHFPQSWRS